MKEGRSPDSPSDRPGPATFPGHGREAAVDDIGARISDIHRNDDVTTAHLTMLEALFSSVQAGTPHEVFEGVSDDFWLWLNTEGCRLHAGARSLLPCLPDEKAQLRVIGLTGDDTLRHGFSVYRAVKQICETHKTPVKACEGILDFGCGWGRIIRFFLKDLDPAKLYGIDVEEEFIDIARRTIPWCHFDVTHSVPPTVFSEDSFDVVYGYSVFSHLPEDIHRLWLAEFNRILKPHGLLIMTTHKRDFLTLSQRIRCNALALPAPEMMKTYPGLKAYFERLAALFCDTDHWLHAYDNGEFCYAAVESVGPKAVIKSYGEACIPKAYVLRHWAHYFELVDFIEHGDRQNIIVVRKI